MILPATGYIRQAQLIGDRKKGAAGIVPFSPSTLWRKVRSGEFPAPVSLSAGVTAWKVEDVRAWMNGRSSWPRASVSSSGPEDVRTKTEITTTYLTAGELAELIGCAPTSFACMRRHLTKNRWPFEPNIRGFPQVSRAYHHARMHGTIARHAAPEDEAEPDFSMFRT